jgi:ABC-type transport system involved in multi-copper enzyme maturation permease subunit
MTRIVRAELQRLLRRRNLVVVAAVSVAFAVVATLAVFASAASGTRPSGEGGTTLAVLRGTGGGTEAFAVGAGFFGFFVFVVFIGLMATDLAGGTFRSLLLRDPHRRRLVVGKVAGTLLVTAGALVVAEVGTFLVSLAVAPGKDVATGDWFSLAGLGAGLGNYLTVLGGVTGWAVLGTTLAVVFRSAPLALGVGFAWAGPFEHIVDGSWDGAFHWFPGLVLDAVIQGGTVELGIGRAVVTAVGYVAVAAAVTLTLVSRRDVTS